MLSPDIPLEMDGIEVPLLQRRRDPKSLIETISTKNNIDKVMRLRKPFM